VGMWFVSSANQFVQMDEKVAAAQAQVENVYQRRADLIPNLVNTVKGYATHEKEVFENVAAARAQAGQVHLSGDASDLKSFEKAQGQLSSALSRLLVVSENYPQLKADQSFLELQSQLEGTENRITIERQRFNEVSRQYNTAIRQFPGSLVASIRGFKEKEYFTSQPGSNVAPKVDFK